MATLLSLFAIAALPLVASAEWPQWRGPRGDGHADVDAPLRWDDSNLKWAVDLPGVGQSSPTVWGDRIFLTAAEGEGGSRVVLCLDVKTGKTIWKHTAWTGEPEKVHAMNPWASATCATDGKHVYAFFGVGGLHCYTVDGEHVWERQLGAFENPWGTAASPVIVGETVVQNCDAEDDSFLAAFDKASGKDVWRTQRERLRGWSTPLLAAKASGVELLLNGETGVRCYEGRTGKELWFRKGDTGRGSPTVTPTNDGLYVVVNGRPGDMFAVRPDGTEAWRTKRRGSRDLPSPIVIGDRLLVVSLRPGLLSTYDAKTGKELERQRLAGAFAASPIALDGHALIPNEDGEVYVLKPGKMGTKVVGINRLKQLQPGEVYRASLTPVAEGILIRSTRALYFVGR